MSYHGDINLGDTIDVQFSTRSFTTGAPTTLTSGTVVAYIGNSTTEITAGITLTTDFDSRTGLHNVRVVATSGNGYSNATNVSLVLSTGAVGGVSVIGEQVGSFSIANRSALRPATAGRTLVVDANGLADANTVKLGPTGSGTAQTARDIGASVLLSSGTGAGQLSFASGVVNANITQVDAAALTAHASGKVPADVLTIAGTTQTARDIGASVLLSSGVGAGQLDFTSGLVKADVIKVGGTVQTARDIGASVLLSSGTGAGQLSFASGVVNADVIKVGGTVQTARDIGASVLLSSGVGTGQLDFASGVVKADIIKMAGTVQTAGDIIADTNDIQSRLPAALVSGRMDSNVQAMATGVIDAASLASDAANEIADALLDRAAGIETGITPRQAIRYTASAVTGVLAGAATTTVTIAAINNPGTNRITATVDADGNRSAVTLA